MNSRVVRHECRHGTFRTLAGDNTVGRCLDLYGEWSEPEVHLFSQVLRSGDVVVEAGANIGAHTVPLSRIVGESGAVHAFEPININHRLLSANLLDNDCLNVKTYQAALGRDVRIVDFVDPDPGAEDNFGAFGFYASSLAPKTVCTQITVDSLNLARLDLLKVDTEGHEREIIEGALATLDRCRPILHLESLNHHAASLAPDGHATWFMDRLRGRGYAFWHYITPLFLPDNWRGSTDRRFDGVWSFDLVGIPSERGAITGLPNAETHPLHCDDPNQWRGIACVRS